MQQARQPSRGESRRGGEKPRGRNGTSTLDGRSRWARCPVRRQLPGSGRVAVMSMEGRSGLRRSRTARVTAADVLRRVLDGAGHRGERGLEQRAPAALSSRRIRKLGGDRPPLTSRGASAVTTPVLTSRSVRKAAPRRRGAKNAARLNPGEGNLGGEASGGRGFEAHEGRHGERSREGGFDRRPWVEGHRPGAQPRRVAPERGSKTRGNGTVQRPGAPGPRCRHHVKTRPAQPARLKHHDGKSPGFGQEAHDPTRTPEGTDRIQSANHRKAQTPQGVWAFVFFRALVGSRG
jgi:hypothetical protein